MSAHAEQVGGEGGGARRGRWSVGCLALLVATAGAHVAAGEALSASERAGKRLYMEGVAASGAKVIARVGVQGAPMPATVLPCANCHGEDGRGRPEGGVRPPVISWQELAKPYGHYHDPRAGGGGRRHPAFDEVGFVRAVTEGVDPAGNRLDPAMPRYQMAASDLRDLIAYLKRIDSDLDAGLGETHVRVALVLQGAAGPGGEAAPIVRAVVEAAMSAVNAAGGVHGRKVELVEVDGGATLEALHRAIGGLRDLDVFAVLMPQEPPPGFDWHALSGGAGVPLVGGIAPAGSDGEESGEPGFFTLGGLVEEITALSRAAAVGNGGRIGAITLSADAAAEYALAQFEATRRQPLLRQTITDRNTLEAAVAALQDARAEHLITLLPPALLGELMQVAEARGWAPRLLVPLRFAGTLLGSLPDAWAGRVTVSMVAVPGEVNAGARKILATARERAGTNAHPLSQVAALASSAVLVEGLKRSGRRASRLRFAEALAGLSEFPTGVGPKVSYGPTRRVGAVGVHVLQLAAGGRVSRDQLVRLDRE